MNQLLQRLGNPAEVRERAVRSVFEYGVEHESQWRRPSPARKIGCTAETLRTWVRQAELDSGRIGAS